MANIVEEYRLDAAAVDEIADKIQRYLETNKHPPAKRVVFHMRA